MKKLAVLAIAGLISVTADASNWLLVATSTTGIKTHIDTDSIANFGNYKKAFVKHDYNEIRKSSALGDFDTMVSLMEIDCNRPMRIRTLSLIIKLNGLSTYQNDSPDSWYLIYPDTVSGGIAKSVCSY